MDAELLDMLPSSVTVAPKTGTNASGTGEPVTGAAVAYPAYIVQRNVMIRTPDNREVVSGTQVYTSGVAAFTVEDLLTLPAGYVPRSPRILKIDRLIDQAGLYGSVIYC